MQASIECSMECLALVDQSDELMGMKPCSLPIVLCHLHGHAVLALPVWCHTAYLFFFCEVGISCMKAIMPVVPQLFIMILYQWQAQTMAVCGICSTNSNSLRHLLHQGAAAQRGGVHHYIHSSHKTSWLSSQSGADLPVHALWH